MAPAGAKFPRRPRASDLAGDGCCGSLLQGKENVLWGRNADLPLADANYSFASRLLWKGRQDTHLPEPPAPFIHSSARPPTHTIDLHCAPTVYKALCSDRLTVSFI